ncbi:MAG: ATP-binding cassette domain-containing protein, partial [Terriglobales bacterium]
MLLSFNDVSLHFGTTVLLDEASFTIDEGERLCLLGRNGTGKSTLLKLITGEVKPDGGEILRNPSLRVALMPQDLPAPSR